MNPPIIVTIRSDIIKNTGLELDNRILNEHGIVGEYSVFKIRPKRNKNGELNHTNIVSKTTLCADTMFDMKEKGFVKNRFGGGFGNTLQYFPKELVNLYTPILDICNNHPTFNELLGKYYAKSVMQAIYLTDTYGQYRKYIDILEYQIVRYRFGKRIPYDIMPLLIEKYPEKLI